MTIFNFSNIFTYLFIIVIFNTLLFLFATKKKDNSIIDIFYSSLFMLSISTAYIYATFFEYNISNFNIYSTILLIMVIIWGVRLGSRIYKKNAGKPEDFRYAAWRMLWLQKGKLYFYTRSYLQIFLLQGVIAFCISLPAIIFMLNVENINNNLLFVSIFVLGFIIWIVGFLFEYFGDNQLDDFLKDKVRLEKERIMTSGLWKYTRHPNYFGESTQWIGIYIIFSALIITSNIDIYSKFCLLSISFIISPLLITYLLRYVSGVPMLEKRWDNDPSEKIGNIWLEYKNKTPVMFPKFFK